MDKYKKKSFMFADSRLSREKRSMNIKNHRESTRHQRLSLLRSIDASCETSENEKPITPKCEEKSQPVAEKIRPLSRLEMLRKWKEEKIMKKQLEARMKKPVFKVQHVAHRPSPFLTDAIESIKNSNSSSKVSHIASSTMNNVSNIFKSKATPSIKISQPANRNNVSKVAQMKVVPKMNMSTTQSTVRNNSSKVVESKVPPIKVSHISQSALRNSSNTGKSKIQIPDQSKYAPRNTNSKAALPMRIPAPNKFSTKIASNKSNLPIQVPGTNKYGLRSTANKPALPAISLSTQVPVPNKISTKVINNKPILSKTPGGSKNTSSTTKNKLKKEDELSISGNELKKQEKTQQDDVAPSVYDETLNFDISSLVTEERKSFAPKNFTFHPPVGLFNFDDSLEDPFAVYEKIKAEYQNLRTSTPRMVNSNPKGDDAIDYRNNSEDKKIKTPVLEEKSHPKNLFEKFNSNSFLEEISHVEDELESKSSKLVSDDNLLGNSCGELSISQDLEKQTLDTINESIESDFSLAAACKTWRKRNSLLSESLTPRRSSRLARLSQKHSGLQEIFPNTTEGLTSSPSCHATNITCDFDQLCLEDKENKNLNISPARKTQQPIVKCNDDLKLQKNQPAAHSKQRKISLLYTPESKIRKSLRQSIRGDLMSFSPNT